MAAVEAWLLGGPADDRMSGSWALGYLAPS